MAVRESSVAPRSSCGDDTPRSNSAPLISVDAVVGHRLVEFVEAAAAGAHAVGRTSASRRSRRRAHRGPGRCRACRVVGDVEQRCGCGHRRRGWRRRRFPAGTCIEDGGDLVDHHRVVLEGRRPRRSLPFTVRRLRSPTGRPSRCGGAPRVPDLDPVECCRARSPAPEGSMAGVLSQPGVERGSRPCLSIVAWVTPTRRTRAGGARDLAGA